MTLIEVCITRNGEVNPVLNAKKKSIADNDEENVYYRDNLSILGLALLLNLWLQFLVHLTRPNHILAETHVKDH